MTEFSDAHYVANELKKIHKPLYLCSLYFDIEKQDAARALYLWAEECRKIPDTISEPMLGEIRTTWWREIIEKGAIDEAGSPLARELLRAQQDHALDKNLFYAHLDGITSDLYVQLYEDTAQIEGFFKTTYGTLFRLLGALCGTTHEVLLRAGLIYGRALHLYEMPKSLQRHKIYWPQDLLQAHQVTAQMVLEQDERAEIQNLVNAQKENICDDLEEVNALLRDLEAEKKAAFAPLSLVRPWLQAVEKSDNFLKEIRPLSQLGFQWHLFKCARKGRF